MPGTIGPKKTWEVSFAGMEGLLTSLLNSGVAVYAPVERKDRLGRYLFARLSHPARMAWNYTTTSLPPKKLFAPPEETLFTFETGKGEPLVKEVCPTEPFVLFGVHPCDLAALDRLDAFYADSPAEYRWQAQRSRATVVGLDCTPDEHCFCVDMGTMETRHPADLFLTPLEQGWLVQTYTDKGEEFLNNTPRERARESAIEEAAKRTGEKRKKAAGRLKGSVEQIAAALSRSDEEFWEKYSAACFSCGSCNLVCPTCHCFCMEDRLDVSLSSGSRIRKWDSCQLAGFAKVAGGGDFRPSVSSRMRHRWKHKFVYLPRRFGTAFCVGCGRCTRSCPGGVDMVSVANKLLETFGERVE